MTSTITAETRTVWKVGDKEFLDLRAASREWAEKALREWAERVGLCSGGEWSQDMVLDALLESDEELAPIFQNLIAQ